MTAKFLHCLLVSSHSPIPTPCLDFLPFGSACWWGSSMPHTKISWNEKIPSTGFLNHPSTGFLNHIHRPLRCWKLWDISVSRIDNLIMSELGPLLPLCAVCEPRRRSPSFGEYFHPSWQFVISAFVLHTGVDILWSLPLPQRKGLPRKARAHSNESQNNSPGCDQDKNHILRLRFRKVYPKINPKLK